MALALKFTFSGLKINKQHSQGRRLWAVRIVTPKAPNWYKTITTAAGIALVSGAAVCSTRTALRSPSSRRRRCWSRPGQLRVPWPCGGPHGIEVVSWSLLPHFSQRSQDLGSAHRRICPLSTSHRIRILSRLEHLLHTTPSKEEVVL